MLCCFPGCARQESGCDFDERRVGPLGRAFERFNERHDRGPRDGAENLFLGLKVEVEGRFRDPGSTRNVVKFGGGKAFFGENLQRGIDNLAWPRVLASAPFRFVIRHRYHIN